MAFSKQSNQATQKKQSRVVFTGKRVKGTWSLESALPTKTRRSPSNEATLVLENRRVRTLH